MSSVLPKISALIQLKQKNFREHNYNLDPISGDLNNIVLNIEGSVVIGRDIDCDHIIKSIEISRRHAILEYTHNQWFITDLKSTNGVFINGNKLIPYKNYPLTNGFRLSFGPSSHSHYNYVFVDNYYCIHNNPNESHVSRKRVNESIDLESKQMKRQKTCDEISQILESELSCSICHELFVDAVNLNCAHTFCYVCIEEWKNSSAADNDCPICRQKINCQNKAIVLDNLIDNLLVKLMPQERDHRNDLIEERKRISRLYL